MSLPDNIPTVHINKNSNIKKSITAVLESSKPVLVKSDHKGLLKLLSIVEIAKSELIKNGTIYQYNYLDHVIEKTTDELDINEKIVKRPVLSILILNEKMELDGWTFNNAD